MPIKVFISYARADSKTSHLGRFINDLKQDLAARTGQTGETALFLDRENIEVADEWDSALSKALCESTLLVALCSPSYFNSDYCGREYQVFLDRRQSLIDSQVYGQQPVRAIFPVLWQPLTDPLPEVVSKFQNDHQIFPSVYAEEGLRYLMQLSRHHDDYQEFVLQLGKKLVAAGNAAPLPPLGSLQPLKSIQNPFRFDAQAVQLRTDAATGPNFVRFVFVAARRDELRNLRTFVECYSSEHGWYWRPYLPEQELEIGVVSQTVATRLRLRFGELSVDPNLCKAIEEAERKNEAVVLLTDAWTLDLEQYARHMREYDKINVVNSAVLILWNDADPETKAHYVNLEGAMRRAFPKKTILQPPSHLWTTVRSSTDVEAHLERTLTEVRMRILQSGEVQRRAESVALGEAARQQGIDPTVWASLQGPGGAPA
jgi:FxsC-like protein